jgi:nucleotide-binding universal stress UspA family protein
MGLARPIMTGIRAIVAGVDGKAPGWWALAWAADEAAVTGAHLTICRVYPDGHRPPVGGHRHPGEVLELADPLLMRQVRRVQARLGGDRVTLSTPAGSPGLLLVEAAGDLLVVGASVADHLSAMSTARWVAAHAACPVVVVRPIREAAGLFAGHVVVGVDGSEPARAALAFAFGYAATHALPLAAVYAAGGHADGHPGDVWVDDRFAETHVNPPPAGLTELDVEVEPYTREYPAVPVKRAVYHGGPVPALLRAAAGARLLVVGDRGRSAMARLLLGSVGQGVVSRAAGPVAVAHAGPHAPVSGR